jgi:membrane fusion protein, heavy metal efflux system
VPNPGQMMRIGMFVTATFYGKTPVLRAAVPASAILHLHDRDGVFVAADDKTFRRVEITSGIMLPGNMQEVILGIQPGTKVIRDALVFQNTVEQ